MLDALHHLVYGWKKTVDQVSSFELLSYMFLVSKERPIRLNDLPLSREVLLDMLLARLLMINCSSALCEIARMIIELLNKHDEMLSYFVLVATFHMDDSVLLRSMRERSVSLNLAMEDWFSENSHTDNLQIPLYTAPIIHCGVTQLPWDISSVLDKRILGKIELNPVINNVSEPVFNQFGQPTARCWSLLLSPALNLYCKYNEDYMKSLNSGCDEDELEFDYHSFDQETAKNFVVLLHKNMGSFIFQPNKENELFMFDVSIFCEVEGLGCNTGTLRVMRQQMLLYQRLTELDRRIKCFNPRNNNCNNLVKECCSQQLHIVREQIFSQLNSSRHIQFVLRSLARYIDDAIVFFVHVFSLLESDICATEISCELKKIYYSGPTSITEFAFSIMKQLNEYITGKIENYLVNGFWSADDAVFSNTAHTAPKDWPTSLLIHLQPSEDVPLSLSILIVQHGSLMSIVKNTEFEKYLDIPAQGNTCLSKFDVLHLGDVIASLYRKVQSPNLINDLLTDLTHSVKVIGTVYLHNFRLRTTRRQLSHVSEILKEEGVPLRHMYAVDQFSSDKHIHYKPPAPLSLFISDIQLGYYKEMQSLLNSLIGANSALEEINVSDELPFVLGEDRRALIRRQHIMRFVQGLKDFILCEIRQAWNILQKQLQTANSVAQLITAFRVVMKSLRQAAFLNKNARSCRQLVFTICSSCIDFCKAFKSGDDRSVEFAHKRFADNAQILCQKLAINQTVQSRNILWRVDYFGGILDTNTVDQSTLNISTLSKER